MFTDFWNNRTLLKRLYDQMMEPVYRSAGLRRLEVEILLFLDSHPEYDTASDIIEYRQLTKSHVSASVKRLEQKGFLKRRHREGNAKTIHLELQPEAASVIEKGSQVRQEFLAVILDGLDEEQRRALEYCFAHMNANIRKNLRED